MRASFLQEAKHHFLFGTGGLQDVCCPVCILHGLADTAVSPEVSQQLFKELPPGSHALALLQVRSLHLHWSAAMAPSQTRQSACSLAHLAHCVLWCHHSPDHASAQSRSPAVDRVHVVHDSSCAITLLHVGSYNNVPCHSNIVEPHRILRPTEMIMAVLQEADHRLSSSNNLRLLSHFVDELVDS